MINLDSITLIILDLNGTLTGTPFIDKQPLALLPGRREKCEELLAAGKTLAIASNQGGVAFGFTTEQDAAREVQNIARLIGTMHWRVSYGHPKPRAGYERYASTFCLYMRKPGPGMLLDLMIETCTLPRHTLMVGDLPEDKGAAENAGVAFMWTSDFFGDASLAIPTPEQGSEFGPEEVL